MTREEVIKHIKDIICENNTVKHSNIVVFEEEKEALRIAIKVLEQEPCEDAISREDVISVINILANKMDESGKTAAEQFISAIKDMG